MKTTTKLTIVASLAVACSAVLGCREDRRSVIEGSNVVVTNNTLITVRTNAPPRWKLLCDGSGKFGFRYPNGMNGAMVKTSRQEVIDFMWSIEDFKHSPETSGEPEPNWKLCDEAP